jgi:hypothetical protein
MPITVKHGPNLQLVGAAGLLAGYGNFQKDEREYALKAAELAEQRRRTNAGIFSDQQRLRSGAYENAVQRAFLADRDQFRADTQRGMFDQRLQQQAAMREAQMAQQQQMLDQRLQSNEEIQEQRAEEAYQAKVNESLQQYDWEPVQQRELSRIDQALMGIESNPHYDDEQRASARRQLMRHKRAAVGYPKKPKHNPIQMFPAVDGTTGQPLTDSRGNPIKGFQNGTRTDIFEDPWIAAQAKAEADERANQARAEADARKLQADTEREEIKRNAELEKAALDLAKDSMKSMMQPDKATGEIPQITPEAAQSHLQAFDIMVAGFRERLRPGGTPPALQQAGAMPPSQQAAGLPPIPQDWLDMAGAGQPQQQQPEQGLQRAQLREGAQEEKQLIVGVLRDLKQQYPDVSKAPIEVRKRVRALMAQLSLYEVGG